MNRRKFLSNTAALSLPVIFKGMPVFAGEGVLHPFLKSLAAPLANCGRILVIVQMNGGNDGLNMIIPLDKYSELSAARPNILIPSANVLPITGTNTTGLHPSMTGIRDLYNNGKVSIVQGVSYPNPNFSHFQAQDIWFTASNNIPTPGTGWLGRQLSQTYPGYPTGYPNPANPDPLAIQIGGALPLALQSTSFNLGYNSPDPQSLMNVLNAQPAPAPMNDYGTELTFLRMMKDQSNAYAAKITAAYNAQNTLSSMYPSGGQNLLADQLKIVARLIGGGLSTTVYIVNHPHSFDTHVDQTDSSNPMLGAQAESLALLSGAIRAFQDDIEKMGKDNLVTGMTYSEFGRRVISNTSFGTDHGTAAPVIFFGAGVNPGIIGTSPVLPSNPDVTTQVPMQYDFRQLYATVMQQWFCMSAGDASGVLNGSFTNLPIFNAGALPLEGIVLETILEYGRTRVEFTVYENEKFSHFEIERSVDGRRFTMLKSVAGNSIPSDVNYSNSDADTPDAPVVYYRIKGFSKQGQLVYSNTSKIRTQQQQYVSIYPNPVTDNTINIEFGKPVTGPVDVTIFGVAGEKLFYNHYYQNGSRRLAVNVPSIFSKNGMYVLNIKYDGISVNEKLVFAGN